MKNAFKRLGNQDGMGLVEMLIAITVFAIAVIMVVPLTGMLGDTSTMIANRSKTGRDVRQIFDVFQRDLRNAQPLWDCVYANNPEDGGKWEDANKTKCNTSLRGTDTNADKKQKMLKLKGNAIITAGPNKLEFYSEQPEDTGLSGSTQASLKNLNVLRQSARTSFAPTARESLRPAEVANNWLGADCNQIIQDRGGPGAGRFTRDDTGMIGESRVNCALVCVVFSVWQTFHPRISACWQFYTCGINRGFGDVAPYNAAVDTTPGRDDFSDYPKEACPAIVPTTTTTTTTTTVPPTYLRPEEGGIVEVAQPVKVAVEAKDITDDPKHRLVTMTVKEWDGTECKNTHPLYDASASGAKCAAILGRIDKSIDMFFYTDKDRAFTWTPADVFQVGIRLAVVYESGFNRENLPLSDPQVCKYDQEYLCETYNFAGGVTLRTRVHQEEGSAK